MAVAVSSAEVEPKPHITGSGNHTIHSYYFTEGPQAIRDDLAAAGAVIRPHFHLVNQFQIVVGGSGTIGKESMRSVALHYTDAFTPYGPIVTAENGLSFFTLRAVVDTGAHYMPGSKEEMERKAGRAIVTQLEPPTYMDGKTSTSTIIEPHADGLAAYAMDLGPNVEADGVAASGTGGQFYVVTDGSIRHDGRELPRLSLIWVDGEEGAAPHFVAGAEGAALLVLQFPVPREPAD